jgi:hypothetical protein
MAKPGYTALSLNIRSLIAALSPTRLLFFEEDLLGSLIAWTRHVRHSFVYLGKDAGRALHL